MLIRIVSCLSINFTNFTTFFVILKASSFIMLVNLSELDSKKLYQPEKLRQTIFTELNFSIVLGNCLKFIWVGELVIIVLTTKICL